MLNPELFRARPKFQRWCGKWIGRRERRGIAVEAVLAGERPAIFTRVAWGALVDGPLFAAVGATRREALSCGRDEGHFAFPADD